MYSDESINKLAEDLSGIKFCEMTARLNLHEIPQICERIKRHDNRDVFGLVYYDVLDLANTINPNQIVHDLHLIFYVFEKILLLYFFNAH